MTAREYDNLVRLANSQARYPADLLPYDADPAISAHLDGLTAPDLRDFDRMAHRINVAAKARHRATERQVRRIHRQMRWLRVRAIVSHLFWGVLVPVGVCMAIIDLIWRAMALWGVGV